MRPVSEVDPSQAELARVLEAEREARGIVEAAEAEARRIREDARLRSSQRIAAAQDAQDTRREQACTRLVLETEPELARIREQADAEFERIFGAERERADRAVEAALAALLGEGC